MLLTTGAWQRDLAGLQQRRLLRPEVYDRRRGGYIDRRRIPAAEAEPIRRASSARRKAN
jgi:hypothetical protein